MNNRYQFSCILLGLALLASTGCANYTIRGVRAEPIPKGSSVGLAVISHNDGGFFSSSSADLRPVLEDYMVAALVGRGFQPRALRLDMLASAPLLRRLLAQGAYSNVTDMRIDINRNGLAHDLTDVSDAAAANAMATDAVIPVTDSEDAPAAAPARETDETSELKLIKVDTEPRNEMTDAQVRYDAMLTLADAIHREWTLDYMIYVHQFADHSFAAHAVRLSDKTVVNSLVVAGNKKGLRRALGEPAAGTAYQADRAPATHLDLMRFAEFFASKL